MQSHEQIPHISLTYHFSTPSSTSPSNLSNPPHFVLNFLKVKMSRPGDWNCRSCQHLNFQRRDSCQRCNEQRPGDYGAFGGRSGFSFSSGADVRPGDWYCSIRNCGAHNFGSRSSCFKCGALKDDSGGFVGGNDMSRMRGFGFGSSSRPGWKSGDWMCSRSGCNEHNFASRMECFRCGAPRDTGGNSSSF